MCGRAPFDSGDLIDIYIDAKQRVHLDLDQRLGQPVSLSRSGGRSRSSSPSRRCAARATSDRPQPARSTSCAARSPPRSRPASPSWSRGSRSRATTPASPSASQHSAPRNERAPRRRAGVLHRQPRRYVLAPQLRVFAMVQHLGQWYAVGRDSLRQEIPHVQGRARQARRAHRPDLRDPRVVQARALPQGRQAAHGPAVPRSQGPVPRAVSPRRPRGVGARAHRRRQRRHRRRHAALRRPRGPRQLGLGTRRRRRDSRPAGAARRCRRESPRSTGFVRFDRRHPHPAGRANSARCTTCPSCTSALAV